MERSARRLGRFTSEVNDSGTHGIRGSANPTAGLDVLEKQEKKNISHTGIQTSNRQPVAKSLYWLHYPG